MLINVIHYRRDRIIQRSGCFNEATNVDESNNLCILFSTLYKKANNEEKIVIQ